MNGNPIFFDYTCVITIFATATMRNGFCFRADLDLYMPLFSIITVTYNAEATLGPTMVNVAQQTWHDYEHLIIDGKSSDTTIEIARKMSSSHTTIISEPDKGLYDAMNKGLTQAKGDYLIFLNAGDTFHRMTTLQTIAESIESTGMPDIVYGQTQLVDENRTYVGERHLSAPENLTFNSLSKGMLVCHQAFIVRRQIAPLYDISYHYSADYDWCIRCLQVSTSNVYIPYTLIDYLDEGVTTANHKASLKERFRIMSKYYGLPRTIFNHVSFIPRALFRKIKYKSKQ